MFKDNLTISHGHNCEEVMSYEEKRTVCQNQKNDNSANV